MKRETWITLYNISHSRDGESSVYNRTAFFVHLEDLRGSSDNKTSDESLNAYDLFIPFSVEKESGKTYLEHEVYERQEDKTKFFTFHKGDIVVKGNLEEEIESEKDFILAHPDAVHISKHETNGFGSVSMRHWEVHCGN